MIIQLGAFIVTRLALACCKLVPYPITKGRSAFRRWAALYSLIHRHAVIPLSRVPRSPARLYGRAGKAAVMRFWARAGPHSLTAINASRPAII